MKKVIYYYSASTRRKFEDEKEFNLFLRIQLHRGIYVYTIVERTINGTGPGKESVMGNANQ